mgnify:CR=1 FL=1
MAANLNARISRTIVALTLIAALIVWLGLMAYFFVIYEWPERRAPMAVSAKPRTC